MSKKIKKKKKISKKKKIISKIDIDQILLNKRQLFLFGIIDETLAKDIIRKLIVLDKINTKPIILWINSRGGNISDGFAIIDAMKGVRPYIVTIINGCAHSMAGLISITGNQRIITENSTWMSHDVATANYDYATKFIARAENLKTLQKRVFAHLAKYTKLSQSDLNKARNEELWLYTKDCKKKGIVDLII